MSDEDIIDYLISKGFGWEKFAKSVKAQGFVSDKQRSAMLLMKQKVDNYKKITPNKVSWKTVGGSWEMDDVGNDFDYGEY